MIIRVNKDFRRLEPLISSVPSLFPKEGKILHDGRNQVKEMRLGGKTAIVKRYKKPNFFLKLQFAFLNNCKAKKAYRYGKAFAEAGLRTPAPIAYIIEGRWPLIRGSYFISEPVEGRCLNDFLSASDTALIKSLAKEIAKMHGAGLMHGDLNLTNIYIDASGNFRFIDTNRSKMRKNPGIDACAENLMRLTHDRELLEKIAREYADIRGWNSDIFAEKTLGRLTAFQRKKAVLRRLKNAIGA
ncbi:MAG: lipopolysaccharide kinase InaA family protein [Clostridium sp.]|nr:lipopolysaccharide kinase InaA family protein [Clostridium sp.]